MDYEEQINRWWKIIYIFRRLIVMKEEKFEKRV